MLQHVSMDTGSTSEHHREVKRRDRTMSLKSFTRTAAFPHPGNIDPGSPNHVPVELLMAKVEMDHLLTLVYVRYCKSRATSVNEDVGSILHWSWRE